MPLQRVPGTEGYAENAAALVKQWQHLSFSDKPQAVLELIPAKPSLILDVGAGIGVDAAALAAMGHHVVAVEPTDALRLPGMALHPSPPRIEWIADSLPDLEMVTARGSRFDMALLSAVWMHLDTPERQRAMPRIAALIHPGGGER